MPTLIFEHGPHAGGTGILGATLRTYGHSLRFVRPAGIGAGSGLPLDLDDVDAIVVGDGPQTLVAGAPDWIEGEMTLLRQAHARQMPIIAFGFGARLLAKALGGEIIAEGDFGWSDITLSATGREDPLYKGWPWTITQLQWQRESIGRLPEGAIAYASSAKPGGKPVTRAYSAGVFAFGFEHQWWLDRELLEVVVQATTQGGADGGSARGGWKDFGAMSAHYGSRLAESIALYLMPVDRVNAGRVKDLHY